MERHSANSLERIQGYIDIEHEKPATEQGKPPAAWPTSGELVVEKLSARYSEDGPAVLHDISFTIPSGSKIGVVGRTGSGKSSLTLSLLRLIPTGGEVFYDGLLTSNINLEDLRAAITIIPQQPELLVSDPYPARMVSTNLTIVAILSLGQYVKILTHSPITMMPH